MTRQRCKGSNIYGTHMQKGRCRRLISDPDGYCMSHKINCEKCKTNKSQKKYIIGAIKILLGTPIIILLLIPYLILLALEWNIHGTKEAVRLLTLWLFKKIGV